MEGKTDKGWSSNLDLPCCARCLRIALASSGGNFWDGFLAQNDRAWILESVL